MDELTHKIEITITGNYPHGAKQHASVSVSGTGDIEHFEQAFRAAMTAAGFTEDVRVGIYQKAD